MSPAQKGPSYAAMRRHHKRIQGMIDDPECVGELLALGLALARYVDFDPAFRDPNVKSRTMSEFAVESLHVRKPKTVVFAGMESTPDREGSAPGAGWKVQELLRKDIRRYDVFRNMDRRYRCGAPMIRRSGTCGKATRQAGMVTDIDTGERSMVGGCSNPRHLAWFAEIRRRNQAALAENPAPVPAANAGGVLARHLPAIDWDAIYVSLDPTWTPPPEENPWKHPRFSLLLGDADPSVCTDPTPPSLAIVHGAGERVNIDSLPHRQEP